MCLVSGGDSFYKKITFYPLDTIPLVQCARCGLGAFVKLLQCLCRKILSPGYVDQFHHTLSNFKLWFYNGKPGISISSVERRDLTQSTTNRSEGSDLKVGAGAGQWAWLPSGLTRGGATEKRENEGRGMSLSFMLWGLEDNNFLKDGKHLYWWTQEKKMLQFDPKKWGVNNSKNHICTLHYALFCNCTGYSKIRPQIRE